MAILNLEPEAETLTEALQNDPVRLLSAGTALELSMIVKARKEETGVRELDFFIYKARPINPKCFACKALMRLKAQIHGKTGYGC